LRRAKFVLVYGKGARTSAKIATRHSRTITHPPATARRLRRSRRAPSRQRLELRDRDAPGVSAFERGLCPRKSSWGEASDGGRSPPPSLKSDAGVEERIDEGDRQVQERHAGS